MENNVVGVPGAGARVDGARSPLIQCDLPILVEQQCHIADRDVIGRVESVRLRLFDIDVGMVDDKEMSERGDSPNQPTLPIMIGSVEQRRVHGGDEIEPGAQERRIEQTGEGPIHLGVGPFGSRSCTLQRGGGHVDRHDPPTSACQPDGISPLAASHVQSRTWLEIAYLSDESTVRLTAPQMFGICVPLVPIRVAPTESFEVQVMGTSKMVAVRLGKIGWVGHRSPSLPRMGRSTDRRGQLGGFRCHQGGHTVCGRGWPPRTPVVRVDTVSP